MAKTNKPIVDWGSVHTLYRLGYLSLRAISEQYKADHIDSQIFKKTVSAQAIAKEAGKLKWKKNLANKVQEAIKEKLVDKLVDKTVNLSDEEIIDGAAEAGANIVVKNQNEIKRLEDIEDHLLNKLACGSGKVHVSNHKGDITLTALNLTLTEETIAFKNLTEVMTKRIFLERQAHNIKDDDVSQDKKVIRVSPMEID